MTTAAIRPARAADADAIAAIYAPYVRGTAITFETDAPDGAEIARRMATHAATHPWLVATRGDAVIGYAHAYPYRARAAYRWVAEIGIYLAADARGGGIGTTLLGALLDAMAERGFVAAIGAVALPNPASEALHARLGFARTGVQPGLGFKHDRWHDVAFWQRDLAPRTVPPPAQRSV